MRRSRYAFTFDLSRLNGIVLHLQFNCVRRNFLLFGAPLANIRCECKYNFRCRCYFKIERFTSECITSQDISSASHAKWETIVASLAFVLVPDMFVWPLKFNSRKSRGKNTFCGLTTGRWFLMKSCSPMHNRNPIVLVRIFCANFQWQQMPIVANNCLLDIEYISAGTVN